MYTLTTIYTTW